MAVALPFASVRLLLLIALVTVPGVGPGDIPAEKKEATEPAMRPPDLPELPPSQPTYDDAGLLWQLVKTLLVLGIVVVSIYLSLNFGLRKLLGIQGVPGRAAVVSVLERVPLDQKRALFLVKVAGEYLLLGGGEGGLSLLLRLDAEAVEKLRLQQVPSVTPSPFLKKLLQRKENDPSQSSGSSL